MPHQHYAELPEPPDRPSGTHTYPANGPGSQTPRTLHAFQLSLFERALGGLIVAGMGLIAIANLRDQPVTNVVLDSSIKSTQAALSRIEISIAEIKAETNQSIKGLESRVRELELDAARRPRTP